MHRRLARELPDHRATAKPVIVDGRRMPYLQGPEGRSRRRAARRPSGSRTSTSSSSCCCETRTRLARALADEAADLRHRRERPDTATGRRSRRSSAKVAREELRVPLADSRDRAERAVSEQMKSEPACEQSLDTSVATASRFTTRELPMNSIAEPSPRRRRLAGAAAARLR